MNNRQDSLITVVDAGSSKICVLVAELQDGVLRYRGHGIEVARGMRKGLIADLAPAAEAINRAALEAERMARGTIETAVVGIGGTHVRGVNSCVGISMGSRMREITREEVRAAVDRARSVALPPDREVLHLLPQEFILDDQPGIHDPIGMVGNKLRRGRAERRHLRQPRGPRSRRHDLRGHRGRGGCPLRRRTRTRRLRRRCWGQHH